MPTLLRGTAVPDAIYRGGVAQDAVYRGAEKVWPVPEGHPAVAGHSWFFTDVTDGSDATVTLPVTTEPGDYIVVHARRAASLSPSLWPGFTSTAINTSRDRAMVKQSAGGESSVTFPTESGGIIASVWVVRDSTYVEAVAGATMTPTWGLHTDTLYLGTVGTHDVDGPVGGIAAGTPNNAVWDNSDFDVFYNSDYNLNWALIMAKGEASETQEAVPINAVTWTGDLGSAHQRYLTTALTRRFDGLDEAILSLNPTHYWRLDDSAGPFADYGSDPVPLTIDTDTGILTKQTVAGKLTGILMPKDSSLRGAGVIPDPTITGEEYLFFTDVNDTTAINMSGTAIYDGNLRLNSQYGTGQGFFPNWRITGTNRNPSALALTGVPAMYSGRNQSGGGGLTFSEAEYPTGSGSSGSQGTHSYAGLDMLWTAYGTAGNVTLARIVVFDRVLDQATERQAIFDAYTNL